MRDTMMVPLDIELVRVKPATDGAEVAETPAGTVEFSLEAAVTENTAEASPLPDTQNFVAKTLAPSLRMEGLAEVTPPSAIRHAETLPETTVAFVSDGSPLAETTDPTRPAPAERGRQVVNTEPQVLKKLSTESQAITGQGRIQPAPPPHEPVVNFEETPKNASKDILPPRAEPEPRTRAQGLPSERFVAPAPPDIPTRRGEVVPPPLPQPAPESAKEPSRITAPAPVADPAPRIVTPRRDFGPTQTPPEASDAPNRPGRVTPRVPTQPPVEQTRPTPVESPRLVSPDERTVTDVDDALPETRPERSLRTTDVPKEAPKPPASDIPRAMPHAEVQSSTDAIKGKAEERLSDVVRGEPPQPSSTRAVVPQQQMQAMASQQSATCVERQEHQAHDIELKLSDPPNGKGVLAPREKVSPAPPIRTEPTHTLLTQVLSDASPEAELPMSRDVAPTTGSPHSSAPTVHTPHVAQVVQTALLRLPFVESLQVSSGGTVDLTLAPEELGRLRMTFSGGEQALVVHVTADRQDTLDLLRRHVDTLAADLRDAGYEGFRFAFGDERPDHPSTGDEDREEFAAPYAPLGPEPPKAVTSGLDLRL